MDEAMAAHFTPGIPDSRFIRGEAPMTKAEVRAVLGSKLRVQPGDTCWDIGAGTGSVSVEMALAAGAAGRVYAIEREDTACLLISENQDRFNCQIEIIQGLAPEALSGLPSPDRIFIGGSGGKLGQVVVEAIAALKPGGVLAADFIVLDNVTPAVSAMQKAGLSDIGVVLAGITPVTILPDNRMMLRQATPVFIVWGMKTMQQG